MKVIRKMCWFLKRCENCGGGMLKELYMLYTVVKEVRRLC